MADMLLDVVNEKDEVIGQELRSVIHAKGLWHREVGIGFITPAYEIIFQRRSANTDTNPNKITLAAGGHVEPGMSYKQAAVQETLEETGLHVTEDDLHLIERLQTDKADPETGNHNRAFREIYAYLFRGKLEDLKIETTMGAGFLSCPLHLIFNPTPEISAQLGHFAEPSRHAMYRKMRALADKS